MYQILPYAIVQFASNPSPLFILQTHQANRKAPQGLFRFPELSFGSCSFSDLGLQLMGAFLHACFQIRVTLLQCLFCSIALGNCVFESPDGTQPQVYGNCGNSKRQSGQAAVQPIHPCERMDDRSWSQCEAANGQKYEGES